MSSDSMSQGYRVAGEAEGAARAKAKGKSTPSTTSKAKPTATTKAKSKPGASSKAKPNLVAAAKPKSPASRQAAARSSASATASDWSAGFGLLMYRLGPEARAAVEKAATDLAQQRVVTNSRKDAFKRMSASAAGAKRVPGRD